MALLEVLRLIREEESPKLSTRLSTTEGLPSIAANRGSDPKKLSGLMRGELDWIVMKTLDKDRNRRYESANGLAMDVQRYLADEQVQACPPSATYRIRKFARRKRAAFWTTGVVALALVVGTVVSAWQAIRATKAEGLAQERSETATANYNEAEEQRQAAKTQEASATEQRKIALANERTAKEQEVLARRRFYAAQMNLAMQAWEAGHPARVLELLESQRPRFDEEDLRQFDWYYLWRLCQGRHRFSLPTQSVDNAKALAFSPDGKTVASGYGRGVKIWDMTTGLQQREFKGLPGFSHCVAYAPDGKTLAACSGKTVKMWDLASGKERVNVDPGQSVLWLAFTADSNKLVMAGGSVVKVWDLTLGREEAALHGEVGEEFESVAVAPNGKTVAAGGIHGPVKIWTMDGAAWRPGVSITGHGSRTPVAISPDGKTLALGKDSFKLYDLATGKERIAPQGHTGPVYSIAFDPDGKTLVSTGQDRTVRVWNAVTGQQQICLAHPGPVNAVALAPDGKMLAAMTSDAIRIWDVVPGEEQAELRHASGKPIGEGQEHRSTGGVASVAFAPDGKSLVSLGSGVRKSWDSASGQEISTFPAANIERTCLAFSPDGKKLVTSGLPNGGIEVWNTTGKREAILQGPMVAVTDLAVSPDGKTVAAVGRSGDGKRGWTIVWDLGTQRPRQMIQLESWLTAVAFSPDGKTLAVGAQFGIVKLFDADTGKERAILQRFELAVTYTWSLVFSPDGKLLATGDREGVVRVWEIATGRLHTSLQGHTDCVWSLDFSPDGKTLASASEDRTIRLWDVGSGQERITLRGHQGGVTSVVFSPDGKTLATGSHDGTLRLWRAATGADAQAWQKELNPNVAETPAAHNERGDRLWQSDRTDDAEKAYRQALARLEKLAAALPDAPGYTQEMVRSLLSFSLLILPEHPQEAEQARQRTLELFQKLSPQHQEALLYAYLERGRKLGAGIQAVRTYCQAAELAPSNAVALNNRAWLFAACPDLKFRDPKRALESAKKSVEVAPDEGNNWNTLGVSHYRAGDWQAALAALEKSNDLLKGNQLSFNAFFLAMSRWQLGDKDEARKWYDQAVRWMEKNAPNDEELIRFRSEAEILLGLTEKK